MVDIIDKASEIEQLILETALASQNQKTQAPEQTDVCLYCGDPVQHPHRWCSIECRDEYEYEQSRKQLT